MDAAAVATSHTIGDIPLRLQLPGVSATFVRHCSGAPPILATCHYGWNTALHSPHTPLGFHTAPLRHAAVTGIAAIRWQHVIPPYDEPGR
jgi:hypothetical protein